MTEGLKDEVMLSRLERSALANWWWTIDRWLIAALGALIVFGLVLTMAASSAGCRAPRPADLPFRA